MFVNHLHALFYSIPTISLQNHLFHFLPLQWKTKLSHRELLWLPQDSKVDKVERNPNFKSYFPQHTIYCMPVQLTYLVSLYWNWKRTEVSWSTQVWRPTPNHHKKTLSHVTYFIQLLIICIHIFQWMSTKWFLYFLYILKPNHVNYLLRMGCRIYIMMSSIIWRSQHWNPLL